MNENAWQYVHDMIGKFVQHNEEVDTAIQNNAKKWNISHMAKVELSILRLGVCEIFYCDDIHTRVTINECVEIAKKYTTEKSARFINGVLAGVVGNSGDVPDES
jgi:N utilization substance protein B